MKIKYFRQAVLEFANLATKCRDCFFLFSFRFLTLVQIQPKLIDITRSSFLFVGHCYIGDFSPSTILHGLINETAENKSKLTMFDAKLQIYSFGKTPERKTT